MGMTAALGGVQTVEPQTPLADGVRSDSGGRLTVPVRLDDGPMLRFAVDSAANASVIAADLVEPLGLSRLPSADIHTLIAVETVARAAARRVRSGAIDRSRLALVVADRVGLGGLDGLLGTDVLADHRLVMEFARRRMRISTSRTSGGFLFNAGRSTVRYRAPVEQRFTNLMMVDARCGGVGCKGIVDTGARVTIVNAALAQAVGARATTFLDGSRRQAVQSATGRSRSAEAMLVPHLAFGGVTFRSVPVLMGDFHTFDLWGLQDRPAMLLGVDVLGLFQRVSIDLGRSELLLEA